MPEGRQQVRRYILTGAPGAGKTAILRELQRDGCAVVEESATDLIAAWQARGIAEPWREDGFVGAVAELQMQRLRHSEGAVQFHDRSVICTLALAQYLEVPYPEALVREAERVRREELFERRVFFIRNLGFIAPTAARTISLDESLRFERMHEEAYRTWGFDLVWIEAAPLVERVAAVRAAIAT
jgi:predicted ATPase